MATQEQLDARLAQAIEALPPEQRARARELAQGLAQASFIQQQNAAAYIILAALDRARDVPQETRQDVWRQVIIAVNANARVDLIKFLCKCATQERVSTDEVIAAIGHDVIAAANTERLRLGNLAQVLPDRKESKDAQ